MSGTAKAIEVWNTLLERAEGDEERFLSYLDNFDHWADKVGPPEAGLVAKAIRFRRLLRKGKPLMAKWGVG